MLNHNTHALRYLALLTASILFAPAWTTEAQALEVWFDNTANLSSGVDRTSVTEWHAQGFRTFEATNYLASVSLLMSRIGTGEAVVELWSGSETLPQTKVRTLNRSGAYSTSPTLTETSFDGDYFQLAANTNYWIVLGSVDAGTSFDWSFTLDDTGSGTGFTANWSNSDDSGATWLPHNVDPVQMRVLVSSTVPEPSSWAMAAVMVGAFACLNRHRVVSKNLTRIA